MQEEYFDVAVIGGGHAACEAAYAAARTGAKTVMIAMNLDHIAQMSCNPCIGGIAKGHLVREIDALGGAMGAVADAAAIQFRMLNSTKGPAVHSPREQCDKVCYQRAMKHFLEGTENLTIRQGLATNFLIGGDSVCGVETSFGDRFHTRAVVMAAGTFLRGKMHFGLRNFPGGRAGDAPSVELSEAIRNQLKLHMGRLKTGTPPRIFRKSIDFSQMRVQGGDQAEEHFSFYPQPDITPRVTNHNMPCYTTYSTKETAAIVKANLDKAPMYNGLIEGIGTRYCPSFEDKVVRFPQHERHLLYLEPEGEYTDEYYLNGVSTSLPPEIQAQIVHSIPGLEHAGIARYAYAIEYDFVYPEELDRTLGVRKWKGLYHAGQINGTSGYEEAAAQGLAAGLNAARFAAGKNPVEFGRDQSYLGVMIDDLVTKEIVEPYRLFTSRAEYRLSLRQDNADFRLSEFAWQNGLLPEWKYKMFRSYADHCTRTEEKLRSARLPGGKTAWDAVHDMHGAANPALLPGDPAQYELDLTQAEDRRVLRQLAIRAHYEGYIRQEQDSVERLHALEAWRIPDDIDYAAIPSLRNESRMKLMKVRPATLSQAGRIDGVTPAEIALLQVHIERMHRAEREKELQQEQQEENSHE